MAGTAFLGLLLVDAEAFRHCRNADAYLQMPNLGCMCRFVEVAVVAWTGRGQAVHCPVGGGLQLTSKGQAVAALEIEIKATANRATSLLVV
jgi:hypothetical protein